MGPAGRASSCNIAPYTAPMESFVARILCATLCRDRILQTDSTTGGVPVQDLGVGRHGGRIVIRRYRTQPRLRLVVGLGCAVALAACSSDTRNNIIVPRAVSFAPPREVVQPLPPAPAPVAAPQPVVAPRVDSAP